MRSHNKQNTYEQLELPGWVGGIVLLLSLFVSVSSHYSINDFGIFRINNWPEDLKAILKIASPLCFLVGMFFFLPVWRKPQRKEPFPYNEIISGLLKLQDAFIAYVVDPSSGTHFNYAAQEVIVRDWLSKNRERIPYEMYIHFVGFVVKIRDYLESWKFISKSSSETEKPDRDEIGRFNKELCRHMGDIEELLQKDAVDDVVYN